MSNMLIDADRALDLMGRAVEKAKAAGASDAEATLIGSTSSAVSYRLGQREDINRSESVDLGLRVLIGKQQAFVSSSDISASAVDMMVERVIDMARAAPEERYAALAPAEKLWNGDAPALDLDDQTELSTEQLIERAKEAEDAALAVPHVTNSEGASAGYQRGLFALATSNGFAGIRQASSFSVSASVIASDGGAMERDYDYSAARHAEDLKAAALIGKTAGERAAKRLNPARIKTQAMPIVFDPRVGNSLLGHFAGAINGQSIARGSSFLMKKLGAPVFAEGVTVIDDPLRRRGLASRAFDAEGVGAKPFNLIEGGILKSWLLDCSTALQLGLETTGHAARGVSGPPHPGNTNLYMAPGAASPADLMADITYGFYITELIGMGVNGVTGDYSRGAAGFLIENGEITKPVSEVTIAGNLIDMYKNLTPASDLEFRYGINAPTLRVEGMTVAGA